MDTMWTRIIWRQFGAAIDMLENALRRCPDRLWVTRLWNDPTPTLRLSIVPWFSQNPKLSILHLRKACAPGAPPAAFYTLQPKP